MTAERGYSIYLVYGEGDQLLYAGCSGNLPRRYLHHAARSPWWHLHTRCEEFGPFSRTDALKAEQDCIWTLGPLCNRPAVSDFYAFGLDPFACIDRVHSTLDDYKFIADRNATSRTSECDQAIRDALNLLGERLGLNEAAPSAVSA